MWIYRTEQQTSQQGGRGHITQPSWTIYSPTKAKLDWISGILSNAHSMILWIVISQFKDYFHVDTSCWYRPKKEPVTCQEPLNCKWTYFFKVISHSVCFLIENSVCLCFIWPTSMLQYHTMVKKRHPGGAVCGKFLSPEVSVIHGNVAHCALELWEHQNGITVEMPIHFPR